MQTSFAEVDVKSFIYLAARVAPLLGLLVAAVATFGAPDPAQDGGDRSAQPAEPLNGIGWEVDAEPSGSGNSAVLAIESNATREDLDRMAENKELQRLVKAHSITAIDVGDSELGVESIVALFRRLPGVTQLRDGGPIVLDGRYATGIHFVTGSIGGNGIPASLPPPPDSEPRLAGIAKIPGLQVLRIGGGISDAGIARLKTLTDLRVLQIRDGNKLTGTGLSQLDGLKKLESLVLPGADLDDAGLASLELFPKLTDLSLGIQPEGLSPGLEPLKNNISFDGMRHVRGLRRLRRLQITGLGLRDYDLAPIRDLTKLEHLELDDLPNVTGLGLTILQRLTNLRSLTLRNVPVRSRGLAGMKFLSHLEELTLENNGLSDGGSRHLAGLINLRRLSIVHQEGLDLSQGQGNVSKPILTGAGLSAALMTMPKLEDLEVNDCAMDDSLMPGVASLTKLKRLQLSDTLIGNDGFRYLAGLKQLEELDVYDGFTPPLAQIGDEGMTHLKGLTRLRALKLVCDANVTDKGLAQLARLTELRRVSIFAGAGLNDISDKGIEQFENLRKLEGLELGPSKISVKGLRFLFDHCPSLKEFHLDADNYITNGNLHTKEGGFIFKCN